VAKELVVVDGGSTDGTREILQRNAAKFAYWVSEPDRGIYDAWNKGLDRANGEWLCFLGSDDYLWTPDSLQQIAPVLAGAYPPIRVVYGQVALVNAQGEEIARAGEQWRKVKKKFQQNMCVPHTGLLHHRSLFEIHGRFDESFRIAGDYEMLLRELHHGDALFVPGVMLAGMRHGGVSSDPGGSLDLLREIRRAQRIHGMVRPGGHWLTAFAKAHLRVWLWRFLGKRVAPYIFDLGRLISGKRTYWTRQ
jgi:glycosyltransferase involved in cell wall biosynthesis